jgi:hypothetical protein
LWDENHHIRDWWPYYEGPTGTDDDSDKDLEDKVKEMEGWLSWIMKQSKEKIMSFLEQSSSLVAAKEEPSSSAPLIPSNQAEQ